MMKQDMKETILLVDDEESLRRVLSISLKDRGYEVHSAANGEEALKIFHKVSPLIVLTDIKMPGMTGIELLGKIKKTVPDTEVIMITGHGDMALAIESLKNDATDFITKPINEDALEIALKRARERIEMRHQLRAYTEDLETLVEEKSARLVEIERTSRRTYQQLFDAVPCYITLQDNNLNLVGANRRFKKDFDYAAGKPCHQIYKNQSTPCSDCPVVKTFEDGESHQWETIVTAKSGEQYNVLIWTAPILNNSGEIEKVMEMSTNITRVRQLQDQLSSLGLKIASISHGIKGLLAGLDGGIYMLDSALDSEFSGNQFEKVEEGWQIVKVMIDQIRQMVLDILNFAKERDLQWEALNVGQFASEVADILEKKMDNEEIRFVRKFDMAAGEFKIDPGVICSILISILKNAMDACIEDTENLKKKIVFGVRKERHHILFTIEDNGIGMDPDALKRIFSLFHSTKGNQGTGLGLFISNQIIRQYGGDIQVFSEKGKGTQFKVWIPQIPPKQIFDDEEKNKSRKTVPKHN